jgi:hypothetical protein
MEKQFTLDRRFCNEIGEVTRRLDATIVLPKKISEYLNVFRENNDETYLNRVIEDLKLHFLYERFFKRPSFKSKEIDSIKMIAYDIRRDQTNPFLTEEENTFVTLKPKYKPKWVDTDPKYRGKVGFLNTLTTNECCQFDPITTFAMDAFRHLE